MEKKYGALEVTWISHTVAQWTKAVCFGSGRGSPPCLRTCVTLRPVAGGPWPFMGCRVTGLELEVDI